MSVSFEDSERELLAIIDSLEKEQGVTSAPAPEVKPAPAVVEPVAGPSVFNVPPAPTKAEVAEKAALVAEQAADLAAPVPAPEQPTLTASQRIIAEAQSKAKATVAAAPPAETIAEKPAPAPAPGKSTAGLKTFIDANEFLNDTKVTEDNLQECFYRQNGLEAYYGDLAAKAQRQHDLLKKRADVREAELYAKHRGNLIASGEKVTEKMVENAVKLDPAWLKIQETVIEAQQIAETVKSCSWSVNNRRDMILELGAQMRQERQGAARLIERDMRQYAMETVGGKGA